ncbi:hypothetical protein MP228_003958 [Amoeboaphelidium protococcarum]|nr:hypothetical protein MP228_003958 [Amoeboaphelidium protococcarum]
MSSSKSAIDVEQLDKLYPTCVLNIGMAGSGKTTLMQRLITECSRRDKEQFVINLDPAVLHIPYEPTIDIRDTIDYKGVMKEYKLGPNGGIMTSLNLFATKFDQVLDVVDERINVKVKDNDDGEDDDVNGNKRLDYLLVDTPGQIEVFTWSASGSIITQCLINSYPTVFLYVIDAQRIIHPTTFMSNMLYACSILYKDSHSTSTTTAGSDKASGAKHPLPLKMVVVINKIDKVSGKAQFAVDWMKDFDTFQAALMEDSTFMSSLCTSMALALEDFYALLKVVRVSAVTGEGMDDLLDAIAQSKREYLEVLSQQDLSNKVKNERNVSSFMKDLSLNADSNTNEVTK